MDTGYDVGPGDGASGVFIATTIRVGTTPRVTTAPVFHPAEGHHLPGCFSTGEGEAAEQVPDS